MSQKRPTYTGWTLTGGKKREKGIQNLKNVQFISFCLFMPNVNMLIVVKVLECIHASTVELRLPQLRGWGVVVALGTHPTLPPLSASAHQYLSPPPKHVYLHRRAIPTPRLTEGHKWYLKLSQTPPAFLPPLCQTAPPHLPPLPSSAVCFDLPL